MTTCPRCGRENAADARFCSNCGNSLVTRVSVQERRVVTALFADLARSTWHGRVARPGGGARHRRPVLRAVLAREWRRAAGRSRSSAAMRSWPSSACRRRTRTIRSGPCAPRSRSATASANRRGDASDGMSPGAHRDRVGRGRGGRSVRWRDDGDRRRDERGGAPRAGRPSRARSWSGANVCDAVRDLVEARAAGRARPAWPRGRGRRLARPSGRRGRWSSTRRARTGGAADRPRRGVGPAARTPHDAPNASARRRCSRSSACRAWARAAVTRGTARLAADGWRSPGRCLPYGEGITYWPVAEIVRRAGRHRHRQLARRRARPTATARP